METSLIFAAAVVVLCLVAFLFYASFFIGSGIYVKALCKGKTDRKVVCLTFDDGPDADHTPEVLDVLKAYEVPATFFCIGRKARRYPQLLRRIVSEGHRVGNHSDSHSWRFPFYPYEKMKEDLADAALSLQTGGQVVTIFRPPFGVTNPTVARVVRELHYTIVGWNIRSFDTAGEAEEKVFRRVVRRIRPGAVILLHDRMPGSAALLVRLLEYLKSINYQVIALDKMFPV